MFEDFELHFSVTVCASQLCEFDLVRLVNKHQPGFVNYIWYVIMYCNIVCTAMKAQLCAESCMLSFNSDYVLMRISLLCVSACGYLQTDSTAVSLGGGFAHVPHWNVTRSMNVFIKCHAYPSDNYGDNTHTHHKKTWLHSDHECHLCIYLSWCC